MAATPTYAAYDYTACGAQIRSQSIVECRLSDWAQNRPLAVCPSVTLTDAEVRDGEIRYGGKLYFSVVARAEDGAVISAERGAEFSHKAECADAAPACRADVRLFVEKTETRQDGRSLILSAIVTAEIRLLVPKQLTYLSGGEGVVCDLRPARISRLYTCSGTAEFEEEFDTDYVGDVLAHSEQLGLTRVLAGTGALDVSGEVCLCVLAKRAGESEVVSYERLIPFRTEIPCDEAAAGMACAARAEVSSVSLTASCDEEKGRCRILAQVAVRIAGRVYGGDKVLLPADAFCPRETCSLTCETIAFEEPLCAFTAVERVSGTAVLGGPVDFSCALQAAAQCGAEAAATVTDGAIEVDGVLHAIVFCRDGDEVRSVPVSLPFSFPVRSDRAKAGDRAEVTALVCGVSVRQKTEGELEAEGTLRLFFTLCGKSECACVTELTVGEPVRESGCAIRVFMPAAGDTLWDTAKKLGKPPEQVAEENPQLTFPLRGDERIVLYRKRELGT